MTTGWYAVYDKMMYSFKRLITQHFNIDTIRYLQYTQSVFLCNTFTKFTIHENDQADIDLSTESFYIVLLKCV